MDSMMDDDPTLPIDFDQTSNFARFLDQSVKDKTTTPSRIPKPELSPKGNSRAKQRSQSANDQQPERPLSRGGTLREQENIISELKKECFGLKMRIYFMEEQLHDTFAGDTEGTIKQNIELKVTIEEIKKDLKEKSYLLTQASQALGQVSVEREEDIKEFKEKHETEKEKTLKECNSKLDAKDNEIRRLEKDLDELKKSLDNIDGSTKLKDQLIKEKDREIQNLTNQLKEKDAKFKVLQKERKENEDGLKAKIEDLKVSLESKDINLEMLKKDVGKMAASPERSNQHYKKLYEDQSREILDKSKQLNDVNKDLGNKTNLVEGLKEHINGMEKSIKIMRSNLHEKEMDKQRVVNQLNEKIKSYQSLLNQKNEETEEKSESLESMKDALAKSNEERLQFQLTSAQEKDSQLVELNIKTKQQQFEIEKLKCLLEEKDKEVLYFGNQNIHLEEESTKDRNDHLKSLEELKNDVEAKTALMQSKLASSQQYYKSLQDRYNRMVDTKDKTMESLTDALKFKDTLIKVFFATSTGTGVDGGSTQDSQMKKLQTAFKLQQKNAESQELKYLEQMQSKDSEIMDLTNKIHQSSLVDQKSQTFTNKLQLKIKGLSSNANEDNEVLDKLRNSLKDAIDKERASRKDLVEMLNEKEEEITKFSSFNKSHRKTIEKYHNYMTSLVGRLPENECNHIIEELTMDNKFNVEQSQEVESRDVKEDLKLKNEELLSLLKVKENLVKDLYKRLHENQRRKNEYIQQDEKRLTDQQELKDLNVRLTNLKKKEEMNGISIERKMVTKDQAIQDLVKSNKEKDGIILDLQELADQQHSTKESQSSARRELEDLEDVCHTLEDEKMQLQAEMDLLKLSKESLQTQLEGAYNRLSRQGTPDYQASLLQELEELVRAAEKEKEKYETLSEKLKNNQHPESCLQLLKNEIAEVEHLRRNLQSILLNVMKKQPELDSFKEQLMQENRALKLKLKDSLKSPDLSSIIDRAESESQSLKEDLKRCELEAKQLNSQLDKMKLEFEQLVNDRDREISQLTDRVDELKQDKELLIQQRAQLKNDLVLCNQQLALLNQRVDKNQEEWSNVVNEEKATVELKEKQIEVLRNEKNELENKLSEAENDLKTLNDNLQSMRQMDVTSLEKKQLNNALEEKKRLKHDAKELCNINDRLRSKLKNLTNNYQILKTEKDKEKSNLHEELQKALSSVRELEEDIQRRQRTFDEEKNRIQNETESKLKDVQQTYRIENEGLQEKVNELMKVNELQHHLTSPELQQLRDENLALTSENNQLKIERLEQSPRNNDFKTVSLRLGDCQQRNKKLQDELAAVLSNHKRLQTEFETINLNNNHEKELQDLKRVKDLLEKQLKESKDSENTMKQQVVLSQEVVTSKNKAILDLQSKLDSMESGIGQSFSPLQASSHRHNIRPQSRENSTRSPDEMSLISEHIKEMRELNKQLQETRKNNDALRQQLEERLKHVEREAKMLNDPKDLQITLIRDNDLLREKSSEMERKNEKMKKQISELMIEKQTDKETIETLHLELHELNNISHNLKLEMEAYDRLVKQLGITRFKENKSKETSDHLDKALLTALLEEIRDLREQLTKSIDANIALKEKLEKELGRPVSTSPLVTPSKDPSMSAKRSLFSAVLQSVSVDGGNPKREENEPTKARVHFSPFETPTRDYNILSDHDSSHESHIAHKESPNDRCQLIGTWSNYRTVLEQVKEAISLVVTMHKRITTKENQLNQSHAINDLSNILKRIKTVSRIIHSFVPHDDANQPSFKEENLKLKKNLASLRKTLKSKEYFIKSAVEMVEENAKWRGKSNEDKSIAKKLMKTRDTLKATRGTMELKSKKAQEKASLDNSFVTSPSASFEEVSSPP